MTCPSCPRPPGRICSGLAWLWVWLRRWRKPIKVVQYDFCPVCKRMTAYEWWC